MIKRSLDILVSFFGLLVFSPLLLVVMFLIWLQDYHSPFYIADRVAKGGGLFKMVKLRSMVKNADKSGVDSTSANDMRITSVGRFIRSYKLDEVSQLWNVLTGDMSLVGPRPNVKRETDLYTTEERKLLKVRPGITDLSSIVFADENDILADSVDPDLDYNQLIRPWKSRLGILYVENHSVIVDLKLIWLTVSGFLSRKKALQGVQKILASINADSQIVKIAGRTEKLLPYPPPGATEIVTSRETV